LALLRVGFAVRPRLPGARCALTAPFHPYLCDPRERAPPSAVCSLWHFPSSRDARALPGTLPCGARTFLQRTLSSAGDPYSHTPYGQEIRPKPDHQNPSRL